VEAHRSAVPLQKTRGECRRPCSDRPGFLQGTSWAGGFSLVGVKFWGRAGASRQPPWAAIRSAYSSSPDDSAGPAPRWWGSRVVMAAGADAGSDDSAGRTARKGGPTVLRTKHLLRHRLKKARSAARPFRGAGPHDLRRCSCSTVPDGPGPLSIAFGDRGPFVPRPAAVGTGCL